jgi:hypothetical protein
LSQTAGTMKRAKHGMHEDHVQGGGAMRTMCKGESGQRNPVKRGVLSGETR